MKHLTLPAGRKSNYKKHLTFTGGFSIIKSSVYFIDNYFIIIS